MNQDIPGCLIGGFVGEIGCTVQMRVKVQDGQFLEVLEGVDKGLQDETGQLGGKWSPGEVDGGDWDDVGCCLVGWVECWYLFESKM